MRLLLVPFAAGFAIFAAVVFVTAAHWNRFAALVAANRRGDADFDVELLFAAESLCSWRRSLPSMLLPGSLAR